MAAITKRHTTLRTEPTHTIEPPHRKSYYSINIKIKIKKRRSYLRTSTHVTRKFASPLAPRTYRRLLFAWQGPHAIAVVAIGAASTSLGTEPAYMF
jgi:hypothetical protein